MTVNYFVTIVMCKDMAAFVTYCLYLKQFCKMHYNMTTVRVKILGGS